MAETKEVFATRPKEGEPWDVVIIGSGPAAFTAAIYTTRGAASTLILGGEKWGGQLMLTTMVDNYPGFPDGIQGPDLMLAMRKQAEKFGAEFLEKNATAVEISKRPFAISAGEEKFLAKVLIVATGAETVWLDVPGVRELIGHGVSSCAPCDAPFFKNKKVAVVGGGDSAMEEAFVLTKYASEVTIIHRRDAFRASVAMQQKVVDNPKVKVMWNSEIIKAIGTEKLTGLTIKNNKDGSTSELSVDGLFVAIGHKPQSELFVGKLKIDERGLIKNDYDEYHSEVGIPGVFVAGDVMDGQYKQAITAAGTGCAAGMDALKFLDKQGSS